MRNFAIGCLVLFAMAGTAFSETKEPPKELAVDLGGGVKLDLVLIPAGSFTMGDDADDEACPQGDHYEAVLSGQVRGDAGAVGSGDGQQSEPLQGAEEPGGAGQLGRLPGISG